MRAAAEATTGTNSEETKNIRRNSTVGTREKTGETVQTNNRDEYKL